SLVAGQQVSRRIATLGARCEWARIPASQPTACAEGACVGQDSLTLKPADLTFEEAAAAPTSAPAASPCSTLIGWRQARADTDRTPANRNPMSRLSGHFRS